MKLCFMLQSTFVDSNSDTDYWTQTTPTARHARGYYAWVYQGSSDLRWSGYLGDGVTPGNPGKACTADFTGTSTGTWKIVLASQAVVQNNTIVARWRDSSGNLSYHYDTSFIWLNSISGTQTFNLGDPNSSVFNVLAAISYGVYRHAGGMFWKTYDVLVNNTTCAAGPTSSCATGGFIRIGSSGFQKKFIILHETGHRMGQMRTGNLNNGGCDSVHNTTCPPEGSGDHSMRSREATSCAVNEGFAHFYAADVFNDHDETDCGFEYYKPVNGDPTPPFDCETGDSFPAGSTCATVDFPTAILETCCPVSAGRGTEGDWLRQFWDVHTNGGSSAPTFTEVINWIAGADAWTGTTAYQELDEEANQVGGQINANWDFAKSVNGVDH